MRVLVTGGRNFRDGARVGEALDAIHAVTPVEILIHGDADGADRLAAQWAVRRGVPVDPYPAKWDDIDVPGAVIRKHTKRRRFYNAAAGHQRNVRMLMLGCPQLVVAFPGGRGTAHMKAQALKAGVPVLDVDQ